MDIGHSTANSLKRKDINSALPYAPFLIKYPVIAWLFIKILAKKCSSQ